MVRSVPPARRAPTRTPRGDGAATPTRSEAARPPADVRARQPAVRVQQHVRRPSGQVHRLRKKNSAAAARARALLRGSGPRSAPRPAILSEQYGGQKRVIRSLPGTAHGPFGAARATCVDAHAAGGLGRNAHWVQSGTPPDVSGNICNVHPAKCIGSEKKFGGSNARVPLFATFRPPLPVDPAEGSTGAAEM